MQELTEEQVLLGRKAIIRYCLIVVCTTAGYSMPIIIAPVRMAELDISGEVAGLTLALPYIIITPLLFFYDRIVLYFSLENSIAMFGATFILGSIGISLTMTVSNANAFVGMFVVFATINGIAMGGLYCCEGMLMLQNSNKEDREKHNGFIKAANGIGAILLPLIISVCVVISGWWLCFVAIGAMLTISTPIAYF
jgi:MFS family permease